MKRNWLITGVSSGLGAALASAVISQGDFVVGTFRNIAQAEAFNDTHRSKALGIVLDLDRPEQIAPQVAEVLARVGHIDVLVNNAGFGMAGAVEETALTDARAIMETNFFGPLQLTQVLLPQFRAQKAGHIFQVSSHGGFKAFAGFGLYNASKFALEGFSEALAQELAPLGIKLTIVEPGPFRTAFAGNSFREAGNIISDYSGTAGAFRQRMKSVNGKQEGDPAKAAQAIVEIAALENPPLRLPLGSVAVASITAKLESVAKDLSDYRQLAERVVF